MIREQELNNATLKEVAKKMMLAARTAPKGKGTDNMVISLVEGDEIKAISDRMIEIGNESGAQAFIRDAANILNSPVMVLLGTEIKSLGLIKCGMCGFKNCTEKNKHPNIPCVFNTGDLGIAIGSAASIAMDNRADNRIMYTVGQAVLDMNLLGDKVKIAYGIPLTSTSKNPFFDRG
ncbi:MAG: ferredoxin [Bacteroidetes bacterium]|nr:ferredoxin [Bacteroidota bacterium]